jgi:hypothetical protein
MTCPATPAGVSVGYSTGDQLPEIVVKDCEGNDVSLDQFCGAEALFVFGAAGWCPLCKSVSSQAEALQDQYASRGLVSLNILVEDTSGGPPDAALCKLWRDDYGLEDVVTLYDPTGATLALWPGGSSSLSAFVDRSRIVTGKLVHESSIDAISAEIEKALGP